MDLRTTKWVLSIASLVAVSGTLAAQANATRSLSTALQQLCGIFFNVLPMAILVVIVLAGVVFAVGQTMGAETRARANVWATNLLIGAIIAGIVIIIAPAFVGFIVPGVTNQLSQCFR